MFVLLLTGCGGTAGATPTTVVPAPTVASTPVPALPIPTEPPPTATPLPPAEGLTRFAQRIDQETANANRRNADIDDKLNAGTTLPPLADLLAQASDANRRAAATVATMPIPANLAYRAVQRYRAAVAATYGIQADAWDALERGAKSTDPSDDAAAEETYQMLAQQAVARRQEVTTAHDQALVALGLAPEGSASD